MNYATRPIKTVKKVWGEEKIVVNDRYCAKLITLNPGFQCSIHQHLVKDETFYVLRGKIYEELDEKWYLLKEGDTITIPAEHWHRFRNSSDEPAFILEVSTRHHDHDVERRNVSGPI